MSFPIHIEEIKKTEDELGVSFPADYTKCMSLNNGGVIEINDDVWEIIPIRNGASHKTAVRTASHIIQERKSALAWSNFPKNGIPIAQNESGDYLLFLQNLDTKKLDAGIFLWNHETGRTSLVSKNFTNL